MSAILGNGTVTFGDGTIQSTNTANTLASSGVVYPTKLMNTETQPNTYRHAFAIMSDGRVKGWGYDQTYTLGTGNTGTNRNLPADVGFPNNFPGAAQVIPNLQLTSYCIDVNGQLWSWGRNDYGSCGNGTTAVVTTPQNVSLLASSSIYGKTVTYVATPCGTEEVDFVMVLCSDGTVHACGYNAYGQCGNSNGTNQSYFVRCGTLTGVTAISCGRARYTACMAVSAGTLYTWGYGGDSQLGGGSNASVSAPTARTGNSLTGKTVTAVGSSQLCCYALCSDNTFHGCGNQNYGQFGIGNRSAYNVWTQINTGVAAFRSSMYDYGIVTVLKTDNSVYYAGYEGYLLPNNINTPYYTDTRTYDIYGNVTGGGINGPYDSWSQNVTNLWYQITGLSGTVQKIIQLGTGSYNSIAILMTNGTIYSCGYNGYGNTGTGVAQTYLPIAAETPTGYTGPKLVLCDLAADIGSYGTSNISVLMILTRKGKIKVAGHPADMQTSLQQSVIYTPTTIPLSD